MLVAANRFELSPDHGAAGVHPTTIHNFRWMPVNRSDHH